MIIQYKIGYQQVKGFHFTEYSNDWKSLLLCSLFEKSRWISVQFLMGQCYRNNLKNLASLLAVSLEKPQNKWARIIKSPAAFDPFRSNLSHVGWSRVFMWQTHPYTVCTVSALDKQICLALWSLQLWTWQFSPSLQPQLLLLLLICRYLLKTKKGKHFRPNPPLAFFHPSWWNYANTHICLSMYFLSLLSSISFKRR